MAIRRYRAKPLTLTGREGSISKRSSGDPAYSSAGELGSSMAYGAGKAALSTGFMAGLSRQLGAPTEAIKAMLGPSLMRGMSFGAIKGGMGGIDAAEQAGLVGKFAKYGKLVGTTLGSLSPFGGVGSIIGDPLGAQLGDLLGDALDMREGEKLRDRFESEGLKLSSVLTEAEGNPILAAELQTMGLGSMLRPGEEQQKEAAEKQKGKKKGILDSISEVASDLVDSVLNKLNLEDYEIPGEIEVGMRDVPQASLFGLTAAEVERFSGKSSGRSKGITKGGGWTGGGMKTGPSVGIGGGGGGGSFT